MKTFLHTISDIDLRYFRNIFEISHNRWVCRFFKIISHTADGYLYPFIPAILFFFNHPQAFSFFIAGMLAFLLELPLYRVIKNGVRRTRPFHKAKDIKKRIIPPDEFSFPSGHASASFMIATITSYFVPSLSIPIYAWAILVGLSRIYLGVHFPTDVFAGMALGSVCSLISLYFLG